VTGILLASMVGCSSTHGTKVPSSVPVELESGFLSDYSDLVRGKVGEPSFVYRAPAVDVRRYDKILLDRVTLWRDAERGFGDIPDDELERLAVRLYTDLWEALDEDYTMVSEAGPGVLRVAVAITDVGQANASMDVYRADVNAAERVARADGRLGNAVRGFLVNASLELELTDVTDGRVIAAAVDRRLAERVEDGRFDDWADVAWGFDKWARLLAMKLREARSGATSTSRFRDSQESKRS
jgi:hypothetical protein